MDEENKIAPIKVPRFNESNGFFTTVEKGNAMSKIKGKDTKPELALRRALWNVGLRYRINVKVLPGKPDIVMRKYNLIIFIDGEFWHGYNWEAKKSKIKTNRNFWIPKIERNIQRDRENDEKLTQMGFHVLRFWEHEIKKEIMQCVALITSHIHDQI